MRLFIFGKVEMHFSHGIHNSSNVHLHAHTMNLNRSLYCSYFSVMESTSSRLSHLEAILYIKCTRVHDV